MCRQTFLLLALWSARDWLGQAPEVEDVDRIAALLLEAPPSITQVRALRQLAYRMVWTQPVASGRMLGVALEAAGACRTTSFSLAARVNLAVHRSFLGDYEESLQEACRPGSARGHGSCQVRLAGAQAAWLTFTLGRLAEAVSVAEAMREQLSPENTPLAWQFVTSTYWQALIGLGRWDQAEEILHDVRAFGSSTEHGDVTVGVG